MGNPCYIAVMSEHFSESLAQERSLLSTITIPNARAEASGGLRDRFLSSRFGRLALAGLTSIGLLSVTAPDALSAEANSDRVYTTTEDVWLHSDPGLGDKKDLLKVMPKGTQFTADCYVNDTPVGPKNNPVWLHGKDNSGAAGYFTDFYSDSSWEKGNTLHDQGLPFCDKDSVDTGATKTVPEKLQPAEEIPTFVNFNRNKAANWALKHSMDTPPNAGSCTWFVSNALWQGDLRETSEWNDNLRGIQRDADDILQQGSDFAWKTPEFMAYMNSLPYIDARWLGYLKSGDYNVPMAKKGDVIVYDWDGKGSPDHAVLVTGAAKDNPSYPLVSGWSEDGGKSSQYVKRGWTWSEKSSRWISSIKGSENTQAWLLHVRTEDEVAIN